MLKLTPLVGNAALKRRLEGARGLSHAYILAGIPGSGKHTLAQVLIAALVCTGGGEHLPCGVCDHCRKAASHHHPDVIWVGEDGKDVAVAQIRALRSDAYIRPNEAARKVYVVENAQTMNASAQNALLKLLEDGPAYAAFLLLTDHAGALLPTVRSRCETLSLAPVTPAESLSFLTARFPALPEQQVRDAAARCEGVLGRAVHWLEGDGTENDVLRTEAKGLKDQLLTADELSLLETCIALEGKDRDTLSALFRETVQCLRDGLSHGDDPGRSLRLIDVIKDLSAALEFNVGAGHVAGALCALSRRP